MTRGLFHVCLVAIVVCTLSDQPATAPLCTGGEDVTSLLQREISVASKNKDGRFAAMQSSDKDESPRMANEEKQLAPIDDEASLLEMSTSIQRSVSWNKFMQKFRGYIKKVKEITLEKTGVSQATMIVFATFIILSICFCGCFGVNGLGTMGSLAAYLLVSSFKILVLKALFHLVGDHPCTTLFFISCGMASLALAFSHRRSYGEKAEVATDWSASRTKRLLTVSATIEFFKNLLMLCSLTILPASVMVLLQLGMDMVVISIAVYFFRGRRHSTERLLGITLIVGALFIVGVSLLAFIPTQGQIPAPAQVVGAMQLMSTAMPTDKGVLYWSAFGYLLARACISAVQQIIDEGLLQDDNIAPSFLAAVHGVVSLFGTLCVLTVLTITGSPRGFQALRVFFSTSPLVTCLTISLIFLGGADHFLNKLGVKNVGVLTRTVVKSLRPTVVWGCSLFAFAAWPTLGGEAFKGTESWCHFSGLALQFLGMLFYAELVLPQNQDTALNIQSECVAEDTDSGPGTAAAAAAAAAKMLDTSVEAAADSYLTSALENRASSIPESERPLPSSSIDFKAIAFDFGGVLFTEGKRAACEKLKAKGYDRVEVLKLLCCPSSIACRRGQLSETNFWKEAQTVLPPGYDAGLIRQEWYDAYEMDWNMVDVIRSVRQEGYSTFAYTDGMPGRVEHLDVRYQFRSLEVFDAEVQSYNVGFDKTHPQFITELLRVSGCTDHPEQLLLIDDTPGDTKLPVAMGVSVIVAESGNTRKLISQLCSLGVLNSDSKSLPVGSLVACTGPCHPCPTKH